MKFKAGDWIKGTEPVEDNILIIQSTWNNLYEVRVPKSFSYIMTCEYVEKRYELLNKATLTNHPLTKIFK